MPAGKHSKRSSFGKRLKKKAAALAVALVLVVGASVGGVLAWLSDQTSPVVNTFTYGDINISLAETDTKLDGDGDANTNSYVMIPGESISKDPVVTVEKNSEDCWLFVKLEKSENFDTFLTYNMADGWTQLKDANGTSVEGVFYRTVDKEDVENAGANFAVIENNQVLVKDSVTKDMLNALDKSPGKATYPTLSVTAYAVQRSSSLEAISTAYEAWTLANDAKDNG